MVYFDRLARGCIGKKQAEEYERKFRKQYQDIQISSMCLTFKEASEYDWRKWMISDYEIYRNEYQSENLVTKKAKGNAARWHDYPRGL